MILPKFESYQIFLILIKLLIFIECNDKMEPDNFENDTTVGRDMVSLSHDFVYV